MFTLRQNIKREFQGKIRGVNKLRKGKETQYINHILQIVFIFISSEVKGMKKSSRLCPGVSSHPCPPVLSDVM